MVTGQVVCFDDALGINSYSCNTLTEMLYKHSWSSDVQPSVFYVPLTSPHEVKDYENSEISHQPLDLLPWTLVHIFKLNKPNLKLNNLLNSSLSINVKSKCLFVQHLQI